MTGILYRCNIIKYNPVSYRGTKVMTDRFFSSMTVFATSSMNLLVLVNGIEYAGNLDVNQTALKSLLINKLSIVFIKNCNNKIPLDSE